MGNVEQPTKTLSRMQLHGTGPASWSQQRHYTISRRSPKSLDVQEGGSLDDSLQVEGNLEKCEVTSDMRNDDSGHTNLLTRWVYRRDLETSNGDLPPSETSYISTPEVRAPWLGQRCTSRACAQTEVPFGAASTCHWTGRGLKQVLLPTGTPSWHVDSSLLGL